MFQFRLCSSLLLFISATQAIPRYKFQIPNGHAATIPQSGITCEALGHLECVSGTPRNSFGLDFAAAGHKWTQELCMKDSDGDGLTNGEELGDPCCRWKPRRDVPLRETDLSHPGIKKDRAARNALRCGETPEPTDEEPSTSLPPSESATPSPSESPTPSISASTSEIPTPSASAIITPSASLSPDPSASSSVVPSPSGTNTPSPEPSLSASPSGPASIVTAVLNGELPPMVGRCRDRSDRTLIACLRYSGLEKRIFLDERRELIEVCIDLFESREIVGMLEFACEKRGGEELDLDADKIQKGMKRVRKCAQT